MILVKRKITQGVVFACARAISHVLERVILVESGSGRIVSNSSVCETLRASERICLIESGR